MGRKRGIGGHQGAAARTTVWLTPPHILKPLPVFDLGPCGYPGWVTAKKMICLPDDGLANRWSGRVWLNPPYGLQAAAWLRRLAAHGDGIALIFARTETRMFFDYVWGHASALLFLRGRLHFHRPDGTRAPANAGAPSVLVAYGRRNARALGDSKLDGFLVAGRRSGGPTRTDESENPSYGGGGGARTDESRRCRS